MMHYQNRNSWKKIKTVSDLETSSLVHNALVQEQAVFHRSLKNAYTVNKHCLPGKFRLLTDLHLT